MTTTTTASTSAPPSQKLAPSTAWLFAFGGVAAAIAISYALSFLGQKAGAAIYFALVAAAGFGSTYLTRAKLGGAILAFLATSVVAAVVYFLLVKHMMSAATELATDAVSGGDANAHAAGATIGGAFGQMFGIFVAVIVFLETIVAGIAGSFAGAKSRGQGGLSAMAALARSAS